MAVSMVAFMICMTAAAVFLALVVMFALHPRIIGQLPCQQILHHLVCLSGHSAVKSNSSIRQSHLGSSSDTAANQCIDSPFL